MADWNQAAQNCEQTLAKNADSRLEMLKGFFKEKKMKEWEDRADKARAAFQSCRGKAGGCTSLVAAKGLGAQAEKEINSLESAFVKWYENEEDVDDAPMFSHVLSLLRETRERFCIYFSCMGLLGQAKGASKSTEECKRELGKAMEKYMTAAEKVNSLAQQTQQEGAIDDASTLLRYLEINHEARLVQIMAPSGNKDPAEQAISAMGSERSLIIQMRAHAYHAKNSGLQKAAMELLGAYYEYQGMLCASYAVAETGAKQA